MDFSYCTYRNNRAKLSMTKAGSVVLFESLMTFIVKLNERENLFMTDDSSVLFELLMNLVQIEINRD
jgi:hypothetical protein